MARLPLCLGLIAAPEFSQTDAFVEHDGNRMAAVLSTRPDAGGLLVEGPGALMRGRESRKTGSFGGLNTTSKRTAQLAR